MHRSSLRLVQERLIGYGMEGVRISNACARLQQKFTVPMASQRHELEDIRTWDANSSRNDRLVLVKDDTQHIRPRYPQG